MEVGVHVWFLMETGWTRGTIESVNEAELQIKIQDELHSVNLTAKGNAERVQFAGEPEKDNSVSDLSTLQHANEPSMLETLHSRFLSGQIFTLAGSTLISVNPFQQTALFTREVMDQYTVEIGTRRTAPVVEPHLFQITMTAVQRMFRERGRNQTIVISGESGSGKSESAKYTMSFLAHISTQLLSMTNRQSTSGVDAKRRILESCPILESFGNAKTTRNENSSRFGKFVQLQFNAQEGLVGAKIETCLLEKVRIVSHSKGERNFHIFYEMCAGLDEKARAFYRIQDPSKFHYLNQGNDPEKKYSRNDAANFIRTCKAIAAVGFKNNEISDLFKILAGIMHMGQMSLLETSGDTSERHSIKLTDSTSVHIASGFFGVDMLQFQDTLCSKLIQAGGETVSVNLTTEQATGARDALAKEIYSRTFSWIVARINRSVMYEKAPGFIGLLDIFGFELFENNSLEQLCINYANEKLQHLYVAAVIDHEQQSYKTENIIWDEIDSTSAEERVKLFEAKPFGVLPLLDETCLMPKGTDSSLVNKLNMCCRENPFYVNVRLRQKEKMIFTVRHFATEVTYNADGFCTKNKDQINHRAVEMLASCNNLLLRTMFNVIPPLPDRPIRRSQSGSRLTRSLTVQFREQLGSLLEAIRSTETHFVRCLKSNEDAAAFQFDELRVGQQLRSSGVLDAVTIARTGFPVRQPHQLFVYRYQVLLPQDQRPVQSDLESSKLPGICRSLLLSILAKYDVISVDDRQKYDIEAHDFSSLNIFLLPIGYQLGRTQLYMKKEGYNHIEKYMGEKKTFYSIFVQTRYRQKLARREFLRRRHAASCIGGMGLQYLVMKSMHSLLDGVVHLQLVYEFQVRCASQKLTRWGRLLVQLLRLRIRSAIEIQSGIRRTLAYRTASAMRLERYRIIKIQSIVRRFLAYRYLCRLHHRRQRSAIQMQCWARVVAAKKRLHSLIRQRDLEIQSAVKIQACIRRKLAYREYKRLYDHYVHQIKSATAIQSRLRAFQAQRTFKYAVDSARRMQSIVRMHLAIRELQKRRIQRDHLRHASAKQIQRQYFTYRQRCAFLEKQSASITVQAVVRRCIAVKRVEEMRRKALIPVIVVQCAVRSSLARQHLKKLRDLDLKKKNDASNRIQRMYRSAAFRISISKRITARKYRQLRERSATKVQSFARAIAAKKVCHELRRRKAGKLIIEWIISRLKAMEAKVLLRMLRMEAMNLEYTRACLVIQCFVRQRLAFFERSRRFRNKNAIVIQCAIRRKLAYLTYRRAVQEKADLYEKLLQSSAVKIQSVIRMFFDTILVDEMREKRNEFNASMTIKRLFKCSLFCSRLRSALKGRQSAARKIQGLFKIHQAKNVLRHRQNAKRFKSSAIVIQTRVRVWLLRNLLSSKRQEREAQQKKVPVPSSPSSADIMQLLEQQKVKQEQIQKNLAAQRHKQRVSTKQEKAPRDATDQQTSPALLNSFDLGTATPVVKTPTAKATPKPPSVASKVRNPFSSLRAAIRRPSTEGPKTRAVPAPSTPEMPPPPAAVQGLRRPQLKKCSPVVEGREKQSGVVRSTSLRKQPNSKESPLLRTPSNRSRTPPKPPTTPSPPESKSLPKSAVALTPREPVVYSTPPIPGTPPIEIHDIAPPMSPVERKTINMDDLDDSLRGSFEDLNYALSPSLDDNSDSDSDSSSSDEEKPASAVVSSGLDQLESSPGAALDEEKEQDAEVYMAEARIRARSVSRGRPPVLEKSTTPPIVVVEPEEEDEIKHPTFPKTGDTADEAVSGIDTPQLTRRVSVDVRRAAKREGPTYTLYWESGLLGLRMKRDPDDLLPTVTRITGKSNVIGIHLVDVGDGLVRVGDKDTSDLSFGEAIELLRVVEKPCKLEFQRQGPRDMSIKSKNDGVFKSELALEIQAKLKELQAEERAKMPDPAEAILDQEISVKWKQGALGMSLVGCKDTGLPQITRITAKATSIDISKIEVGNYLTQVGNYITSSGSFNDAIQQLHQVPKPVYLKFCPSSTHQGRRPTLRSDEFEFVLGKKHAMNFTLAEGQKHPVIVSDVGKAKNLKSKKDGVKCEAKPGDIITYINDDEVSNMSFKEALLKIREGKRPMTFRFKKGKREKKKLISRSEKKISSKLDRASSIINRGKAALSRSSSSGRSSTSSSNSSRSSSRTNADRDSQRSSGRPSSTRESIGRKSTASPASRGRQSDKRSDANTSRSSAVSRPSSGGRPSRSLPSSDSRQSSQRQSVRMSGSNRMESPDPRLSRQSVRLSRRESPDPRQSVRMSRKESPDPRASSGRMSMRMEPPGRQSVARTPSSKSKAFRVIWHENISLGLTLKPDDRRRPIVARITGKNTTDEMKKVRVGDILVSANGVEIKPAGDKFKHTLETLAKIQRPATLIFKRPTIASDASSETKDKRPEYQYRWTDNSLGLIFAPHAETRLPVLSKGNLKKDSTRSLSLGDVLTNVGSVSLRGMTFTQVSEVLKKTSLPTTLTLRKRQRSSNPASNSD